MEIAASKPRRPKKLLDRADWLRAGRDALVRTGPQALTLAQLARSLGVTTGSFYWHFKSRDEYLRALLDDWIRGLLEPTAHSAFAHGGDGTEQLRELGRLLAKQGLPELDTAMRSWARTDPCAAAAVERADRLRTSYLARFFSAAGIDPDEASKRAELVMWCWAGSARAQPGQKLERRARRLSELIEILATS